LRHEEPTSGKIFFDGRDVTRLPTQERNTAAVPQTWALWPHMTVFENVAYGLRLRKKKLKLTEEEIRRRVMETLELVDLAGLEERRSFQLSGGQQQRVAPARALVVQPEVLLLDEPLANQDAKLRLELREEVRHIAKKLSITTIYVTHDQEEAFAVADRIAVMNAGRLQQVGETGGDLPQAGQLLRGQLRRALQRAQATRRGGSGKQPQRTGSGSRQEDRPADPAT
jgi:ABC-type Fe3+/spermidine/putrescine transport system ATPase subunit